MKTHAHPRFPLFVKILGWFFLNLLMLAIVVVLILNTQFRVDLNWIFSTSAGDRVNTMRRIVTDELNLSAYLDWNAVLERLSNNYGVHFALFDLRGQKLVGPIEAIPVEVRNRILERTRLVRENSDSRQRGGRESRRALRDLEVREFMRSSNPKRYWLLLNVRLENPQTGPPFPAILVTESEALSEGGLIFDLKPWIIFGAGAFIFSILFWLPLISGITRTIGQMTQATKQMAEGRFDVRVTTKRRDELGVLGQAINQMAVRLDGFVAGQKRFLGDVAHELCAPLARLQMGLGILEQRAEGSLQTYALSASEKAAQMATLVNDLLAFSKASFGPSAVNLIPVNVREIVDQAVEREKVSGAVIEIRVAPEVQVIADPDLLARALSNLIRNAIHHGGTAGPITIAAEQHPEEVIITVADSGPGVPPEDLPKIFDAFYRVDRSRTRDTGGIGLGLAIVKSCVESCGGSVRTQLAAPHGLEVTILLPTR